MRKMLQLAWRSGFGATCVAVFVCLFVHAHRHAPAAEASRDSASPPAQFSETQHALSTAFGTKPSVSSSVSTWKSSSNDGQRRSSSRDVAPRRLSQTDSANSEVEHAIAHEICPEPGTARLRQQQDALRSSRQVRFARYDAEVRPPGRGPAVQEIRQVVAQAFADDPSVGRPGRSVREEGPAMVPPAGGEAASRPPGFLNRLLPNLAGSQRPSVPEVERAVDNYPGEGDTVLSINSPDADIRETLDLLAQQGGLNILASPNVQGQVSASLAKADVHSALDAILRISGFVAHREGDFIYVGTPEDLKAMAQNADSLGTRLYRPNYVAASELEKLVTPLLSPDIGSVSVSTAPETGIGADTAATGADGYAGGDVLLVRDYESVLVQIDQIVEEVDRKPLQVAIEAMIVAIKLDDTFKMGMDWDLFRNNDNMRLVVGSPPPSLGNIDMKITEGGIKFGFLDGSLGAFLNALETVGDANVIAAPRLLCLNKQRAEIHIGSEKGYVSTTVTENAATETVECLEVGTQLRLRPYVSEDGMIRMEIHPELSTGDVKVEQGITIPDKDVTQVTTNVMIRDGRTVVIGGLIREDLHKNATQVPFFGSLPLAGLAFRKKTEDIDREEVIILITPHIVYEPKLGCDGEQTLSEYNYRQSVYRDKMSPISKRFYGRHYYRLAAAAWSEGDACKALRYINLSIQHDPMSRQASVLRAEIVTNSPYGDRNVHSHLRKGLAPWAHPVGGRHLPFWMYDELGAVPEFQHEAPQPFDRGVPGSIRQLDPPRYHEQAAKTDNAPTR